MSNQTRQTNPREEAKLKVIRQAESQKPGTLTNTRNKGWNKRNGSTTTNWQHEGENTQTKYTGEEGIRDTGGSNEGGVDNQDGRKHTDRRSDTRDRMSNQNKTENQTKMWKQLNLTFCDLTRSVTSLSASQSLCHN